MYVCVHRTESENNCKLEHCPRLLFFFFFFFVSFLRENVGSDLIRVSTSCIRMSLFLLICTVYHFNRRNKLYKYIFSCSME